MGFLKSFSKIIFSITLFLLPLFIFIFVLRLNKGLNPYFGYEEIFSWIEEQDFYKPYEDFIDFLVPYIEKSYKTYIQFAADTAGFNFSNFFPEIVNVFQSLLQLFGATFKLLAIPFIILYFFIRAIVLYIGMFVNFMVYVVSV